MCTSFSHEINGADGCRREVIEERGRGEDFTSYPLPLISFFIFLFFLRLLFDNLTREKELLRLTSSYLRAQVDKSCYPVLHTPGIVNSEYLVF